MPCPFCNLHHTSVYKGATWYMTRLSSCPTFRNLSIPDKTTVLRKSKGCVLCLDWTGVHPRDNCLSRIQGKLCRNCRMMVNGVECGN